jgi:glutamyl-tRNA synthetase
MIFNALKWVGLTWDEGPDVGGPYGPYRQSERTDIYREHVEILLANGTAYRSFETAEELEAMRQSQIAAKQPPRYNGAHRHLTPDQIAAYIAEGRPYTVRLKVPQGTETTFTEFKDELRGDIRFDHNNVDDQVLMKSDGFPTYHLANVVDDHLMRITDVIRAEEWISSTPKHVLLYKAFGWDLPRFWHMPLLRNIDKSKISKRKNPVSLVYYRESGYLPEAMLNFLGLMGGGMAQPTEQEIVTKHLNTKEGDIFSLAEMLEKFDFKRISLGGPVFDLVKLKWLNGEYLRKLSPSAFFSALRHTILSDDYLRAIAPLVQARMETLGQFGDMTSFFFSDNVLPPESVWLPKDRTVVETLKFTEKLLTTLETSAWDSNSIETNIFKLGSADLVPGFLSHVKSRLKDSEDRNFEFFELVVNRFYEDEANLKIRLGLGNEKSLRVYRERLQLLKMEDIAKTVYDSIVEAFLAYLKETGLEWSVAESFMLLRAVLTGSKQSPPILDCLVVFGKARTLDRIRRFIEAQKMADARRK